MPQILHDLIIRASLKKVYDGISQPALLDEWWTNDCTGTASLGSLYRLGFTPDCVWSAEVTDCVPNHSFELRIFDTHTDWDETRVRFKLASDGDYTKLQFCHSGWRDENEHFRVSSYCWAIYLKVLKGYLEKGIRVKYDERYD